ncbi:hypothetical protein QLX08_007901 [Tetragonisca angustula]|uniref:Uncharacterized protein n=1 Tax=Tetragonisca angustula TaxID=166442 RepID=A0AAW0ZND7_9HYME
MLESKQRSRRHELQLESNSNRPSTRSMGSLASGRQGLVTCGCHRRRTDAHRLSQHAFLLREIEEFGSSYGTLCPVTCSRSFEIVSASNISTELLTLVSLSLRSSEAIDFRAIFLETSSFKFSLFQEPALSTLDAS